MKSITMFVGILLVIFGIVSLGYQGFNYTQKEKVAEVGSVEVTADKEKTVFVPPIVGGLSLVAGIVLVVIGRKKI